jgi:hypothetical protein
VNHVLNEHLKPDQGGVTSWSDLQLNIVGADLYDFRLNDSEIKGEMALTDCTFHGTCEIQTAKILSHITLNSCSIVGELSIKFNTLDDYPGYLRA